MNDDLASKQAFLRENVLEMGYDADEFMSFLQLKKGENGLDLNNWEMNELITVVNDFVKSKKNIPSSDEDYNQENKEDDNIQNYEEQNENIISDNNNNHESEIIMNNNNDISSNSYNISNIGKCQASEMTAFSGVEKPIVKLSSPKKITGKMFSKAFISYVVTTEPFNFQTNKRYSDFAMLKKILSIIYTNCVVPPLCKKNFSDRFSEYLIEKRMRSIEKFMNGILEHPLMKNSEVVKDFLSLSNAREYNSKMDKYNKIKKSPSVVRQIKTISGEVNIGINNEKEVYFDNIKNYVKGHYQLLQKITKGYKSLMNIMQQLSNKMIDISKLWKQVLDKSIKYYDSHNTSETFNIMSKLMENWAEIQKTQIKIINVNIREYFRYVKNEFNGLKEMSDKVQTSKNTYTKFNEKLIKMKESLYEKRDPEQWQLKDEDKKNMLSLINNKELAFSKMLPQDTLKLYEYRDFYGCMLNSLIEEFERIRKINAKRHKEKTTKFVRELSSELTNFHVGLADRLCEFHELRDDKDVIYKNGGALINRVEAGQEVLDEDNNININNNKDNNNIIEENNINNVNNIIEDNNNNNINNNIENDVSKDFEKIEKADCIENSNINNNKKNNIMNNKNNNINNINSNKEIKEKNKNENDNNNILKKEKIENNKNDIINEEKNKEDNIIEIKKEENKNDEKIENKEKDNNKEDIKEKKDENNNIIENKNENKEEIDNNNDIDINKKGDIKEENKEEEKKDEKKDDYEEEKKEEKKKADEDEKKEIENIEHDKKELENKEEEEKKEELKKEEEKKE